MATSPIVASVDHGGFGLEAISVYVPEAVSECFELHIATEESSDVPFLANCKVILDGRIALMILRLRLKRPEGRELENSTGVLKWSEAEVKTPK
jgi:hypothetical protein